MSGAQDLSACPEVVQQLSTSKEEVSSEQQGWSSSLNQKIKEEPEELWSSQVGEQLQEPEGDNIIKFTFVPVKSEDDEENPQSSQLYQRQTEQMEAGADGEDCGEAEAARYYDQDTEVKTDDSSDPETDDSTDWREATEHQTVKTSQVC
ncbi:uncharacterized protein LOC121523964 isoform X3 [Cheilinus undulatus]|uniref:uncharacterized protein LOC121523964 isoform X3 n=1 Tax=Cheilinus undulatus TaxID=241271 RepID=UPI001BD436A7|nr:uncharacterized protein LOC121523964 isoform X3 [Cheilinus undulatus]